MIEECVIIGGGVSSLSAANQLVHLGISPLLIESGNFPCHRICGEYFSHECLEILQRWDIGLPSRIDKVRFVKGEKQIQFSLPIAAGSCSHFEFDINLFNRALAKGARALCGTSVQALHMPSQTEEPYELELSNGQKIKARHLIIGTGKIPKTKNMQLEMPKMKYLGFKAHFEGIEMDNALEMNLFPGGYLGIAKVNENVVNIAAIVSKPFLNNHDPENFINKVLFEDAPSTLKDKLKNASMIFPKWLMCQIPEFGIRNNPVWERVFWIGDAAGGIPPVSGEGLAIAITSGCMAADYLAKKDAFSFKTDWLKRYRKRYFWAQLLHYGLLNPWMNKIGFQACSMLPSLPLHFWKLTRETKNHMR